MKSYEVLYIIDNELSDEAKEALIQKFSDMTAVLSIRSINGAQESSLTLSIIRRKATMFS